MLQREWWKRGGVVSEWTNGSNRRWRADGDHALSAVSRPFENATCRWRFQLTPSRANTILPGLMKGHRPTGWDVANAALFLASE